MRYRLKITLSDSTLAQLRDAARQQGAPVARLAAETIAVGLSGRHDEGQPRSRAAIAMTEPPESDARAAWLEPYSGDPEWRANMWGSIVALYGRYPRALAHLKEGWWNDTSHVESLCALVVWRDWIDQAADDPRHESAFHAQLTDYSLLLRQEGGSVSSAWKPGAPARRVGVLRAERAPE